MHLIELSKVISEHKQPYLTPKYLALSFGMRVGIKEYKNLNGWFGEVLIAFSSLTSSAMSFLLQIHDKAGIDPSPSFTYIFRK